MQQQIIRRIEFCSSSFLNLFLSNSRDDMNNFLIIALWMKVVLPTGYRLKLSQCFPSIVKLQNRACLISEFKTSSYGKILMVVMNLRSRFSLFTFSLRSQICSQYSITRLSRMNRKCMAKQSRMNFQIVTSLLAKNSDRKIKVIIEVQSLRKMMTKS